MARALNVRSIDAIKSHKTKRQEIPDGTVSGLYLVVQSSGAKSWAVRYRHEGKPAKLTLGPWPRLGLAEARQAARETLGIVSVGADPTADRVTLARLKRQPAPDGAHEFGTVLDRFLKSQRTKGRRSTDKVKTLLDKDATAYWRHRQIASITPSDVVERIEAIVGRGAPVSASRFRAWVSKLFNYTVKAQLRPDNPAASTENPVDAKARQRKRTLDDRELVLVWKAAERLGYPFGPAVQLLVLSGQRLNEVCAAPRSEFDLDARQWIIAPGRAKNNVEHLVPLSAAACDIITGVPTVEGGGDFLFTTTGDTPISGFSKAKRRLDALIAEVERRQGNSALDVTRREENVQFGLGAIADSDRGHRKGDQSRLGVVRRRQRNLQQVRICRRTARGDGSLGALCPGARRRQADAERRPAASGGIDGKGGKACQASPALRRVQSSLGKGPESARKSKRRRLSIRDRTTGDRGRAL